MKSFWGNFYRHLVIFSGHKQAHKLSLSLFFSHIHAHTTMCLSLSLSYPKASYWMSHTQKIQFGSFPEKSKAEYFDLIWRTCYILPLPIVTCYLLLPIATYCNLLPIATFFCYLLQPATYCYLLLLPIATCYLLLLLTPKIGINIVLAISVHI